MSCCEFTTPVFQCWSFVMAVSISAVTLTISILGLAEVLPGGDACFYAGLIGTVIGLWFPRPTMETYSEAPAIIAKGADDAAEQGGAAEQGVATTYNTVYADGEKY